MPTFKRFQGKHIDSKHPKYATSRWWYQFRIRGKTYTGSLPEARTKKDADDAEREIRSALFEKRYGGPSKDVGLSDYVDQTFLPWSEVNKASYRDDVSRSQELKAFFGNSPVQSIRTTDCDRLKRGLMKKKTPRGTLRTDATVNRYTDLLSAIFTRAVADRLIGSNPCAGLSKEPEGDGRERSLSADEHEHLLNVLVEDLAYMRAPALLALGTGLRRGEMLKLKIECVNLSDTVAHVMVMNQTTEIPPDCLIVPARKHSKNKYTRVVPLNQTTRAILVDLTKDRPGDEVLFTAHANGVNHYWLKSGIERACERAKIAHGMTKAAGLTWHDLRRTFATRLRANNVHEYDIQYLLGHKIQGITKVYARQTIDSLRTAVGTLSEPWGKVILFNRKVS